MTAPAAIPRSLAWSLNPLIGNSYRDTCDNVSALLNLIGDVDTAGAPDDRPMAMHLVCSVAAKALSYESGALFDEGDGEDSRDD